MRTLFSKAAQTLLFASALSAMVLFAGAGSARALPVPGDPYEPNDSTGTATPIVADGGVVTQYSDAAADDYGATGSDYLSFAATEGKLYDVVLEKGQGGGLTRLRVIRQDGTDLSGTRNHVLYGSVPGTSTTEIWASAAADETLYVVVDLMSIFPRDVLLPYTIRVTEHEHPVIEGTVRDPKTNLPVAGALVRGWQEPYGPPEGMPNDWYRVDETTTGPDGSYRLAVSEPGQVWLRFDDLSGARIGEWYRSTPFFRDATVLDCAADARITGVNGQLRQPAHVVFRAIVTGSDAPVPGTWVGVWSGGAVWAGFTNAAGAFRTGDLDPRLTYSAEGNDTETGYHYLGVAPASFTLADGQTLTVTTTYSFALAHDLPGLLADAPSTSTAYLRSRDVNAVYRTQVSRGHTYRFWLSGTTGTDFDLGLYEPATDDLDQPEHLVGASVHHASSSESITYYAEEDGWCYPEVLASGSSGTFTLRVADLAALDRNGDIPGAALRAVPFASGGSLKRGTNEGDVVDVPLTAGVPVTFTLTSTSGSGALNLFSPATNAVFGPDYPLAVTGLPGPGTRSITFTPKETGVYHAWVGTEASAMSYTLRAYKPPATKAALTTPRSVTSVRHGYSFRVTGSLKPRHASGSKTVTLYCYRLQSGSWVLRKTVLVKVSNSGSSSAYSLLLSLPYSGRWRIRAYHSDAGHAAAFSGSRYITAR